MKIFKILAIAITLINFSGCAHFSTPQGPLYVAYEALNRNNFSHFMYSLSRIGKKHYGNEEYFYKLKRSLLGKKLSLSKPVVIEEIPLNLYGGDFTRIYSIDILDKNHSILHKVAVECYVRDFRHLYGPNHPESQSSCEIAIID